MKKFNRDILSILSNLQVLRKSKRFVSKLLGKSEEFAMTNPG
jgi:hypothetical protein